MQEQGTDALLTPSEVAALFRVDPKTMTRWATAGKFSSIKTLGVSVATVWRRFSGCWRSRLRQGPKKDARAHRRTFLIPGSHEYARCAWRVSSYC